MANYPPLPDLGGCDVLGIQRGYLDPSLSTPFENGMVQTRARFPRVRRTFNVPYRYIDVTAFSLLDDFIRNVVLGGSGIFVWTDPLTGEEINVRFANNKLPQLTESWVNNGLGQSFNLELEEV